MYSRQQRRVFPAVTGFSARNLRDMKHLFVTYSEIEVWRQDVAKLPSIGPEDSKWRQPVAKLSDSELIEGLRHLLGEVAWGHNLLILSKITLPSAKLFYLYGTVQFGWTRSVLLNQTKSKQMPTSEVSPKRKPTIFRSLCRRISESRLRRF